MNNPEPAHGVDKSFKFLCSPKTDPAGEFKLLSLAQNAERKLSDTFVSRGDPVHLLDLWESVLAEFDQGSDDTNHEENLCRAAPERLLLLIVGRRSPGADDLP